MLPSETMIWQPEFTDKTLSRKPGAVQFDVSVTKELMFDSEENTPEVKEGFSFMIVLP
ncbi:hypothetical protein EOK62_004884 [Escherichia coli]|nr:hypothetical protein [Escherichia coli]